MADKEKKHGQGFDVDKDMGVAGKGDEQQYNDILITGNQYQIARRMDKMIQLLEDMYRALKSLAGPGGL